MGAGKERGRIVLTLYRRHVKRCDHRHEGRDYRRCKCPIWADGLIGGQDIRESLKTRDWQKASDQVRAWEARGTKEEDKPQDKSLISIAEAWKRFDADARAQGLRTSTLYKYTLLQRQMTAFSANEGLKALTQFDVDTVSRFRATWKDGPLAATKKLERLRAFLGFCRDRNWIDENPAKRLKSPKFDVRPTEPFTNEEMMRINATATRKVLMAPAGSTKPRQLRALALLLRYTGLRISDAVGCSVDRLRDGKIWLYTHKTGQHVYCPLPAFLTKELESLPRASSRYWFYAGNGTLETARKKWSEALAKLFTDAEVQGGHAHRFRDTFACELLLDGCPIENVAAFLGHSDVRITQKHYSPWVLARQERAEADVRRSWERDPLILMEAETKGTREVHGQPN
jgi:integrase/recombinase XerD